MLTAMSSTAKVTICFGGVFLDTIRDSPRFGVGVDAAEVFAAGCPSYSLWYAWMTFPGSVFANDDARTRVLFPGLIGGKLSEPSLCILFGIPLSCSVNVCLLSQASVVFTDLYSCVVWLVRWVLTYVFSLGSMLS